MSHVSSKGLYWTIFATLLVCTGLTVVIARMDFGAMNTPIALAIAGFKATLVILFLGLRVAHHPVRDHDGRLSVAELDRLSGTIGSRVLGGRVFRLRGTLRRTRRSLGAGG